jgi:polar amino acid transport system substrate-binding protein
MSFRDMFCCFVFLLLLFPTIVLSETVTLVADEWPPFNSVPNSSEEGFIVDIARVVFREMGINVIYETLPWKRAIDSSRDGHFNGIIGASKTDAPDFVFPSEELSRNILSFYVKKDFVWEFKKRSDIDRISLGVIGGYDYRMWLLAYISAHKHDHDKIQVMTGNQPLRKNILKLLNNRIDAIVDNEA